MYQTILVPLDGSSRAEKILPHVEGLANCMGSKVVLLEVVAPVYFMMDPQVSFTDINIEESKWRVEEAQAYLDKQSKELKQKQIEVETRIEQGPVVETIIDVAREVDADLIAYASHGRSGLGQVFYGSVAAGILHRIDRPMLVIRSRDDE